MVSSPLTLDPIYTTLFVVSFILTLIIAFVVSIDVVGMILSQSLDFKPDKDSGISKKLPSTQANIHATWHAGLFIGYMIVVNIFAFAVSYMLHDILINLWNFVREIFVHFNLDLPEIDGERSRQSALTLLGVATILIVWSTYSQKIAENHALKIETLDVAAGRQRWDISWVYRLVAGRIDSNARKFDHVLAAAVAIDMLAVSALIRVWFKGAADAGEFESSLAGAADKSSSLSTTGEWHIGFVDGFLSYEEYPIFNLILNIGVFSVLIYNFVFLFTWLAAHWARSSHKSGADNLLTWLRIAEPWLIFTILFTALPHLIGVGGGDWGVCFNERRCGDIGKDVFVAGMMGSLICYLLVFRHGGISEIRKAVKAGSDIRVIEGACDLPLGWKLWLSFAFPLYILYLVSRLIPWSRPYKLLSMMQGKALHNLIAKKMTTPWGRNANRKPWVIPKFRLHIQRHWINYFVITGFAAVFFKAHFKLSLSATSSNFASETVLTIIGGVAFIITGVRLSRALERERLITIFEFFNRALIEISNIEDAAKRREEFGDSLKAYGCTVLMLFFCVCGIFANRAAYPWDERSWIEFGTALITCITLVALAAYLGARSRFNRVSMDTPQALKLDDFLWIPGILGFLWAFYKVVSP